ncbi:1-phosphofructokinase family hexose kinase [Aquisphaera insulae]|uniref:1-phosphofructokinase family hexose kinase n=1 Tax=Aquisphaera insulae TaxID=2712864 RepID=UPI0013EC5B1A|nr:PfkB family carbohydrate kinase [Aquisphaera insulae]
MIVCVTLNSCLDKTLVVPEWQPGDLVRGKSVREVVGGKGNNVARALKRLGRSARPATFLGGPVGRHCAELLRRDDGFDAIAVPTQSETREILTVLTEGTPNQTAFFDPDPAVTPREAEQFADEIEKALAGREVLALTLSGSSPSPATHGLFSDLISLARARRIPVFLDTYGPALDAIWGFWPMALQLNRKEAAGRLRKTEVSDGDVLGLLADWSRHGVTCGVVTDGPRAVLAQIRDKRYRVIPPSIKVVNPIGSGDSLLAGLVDGWLNQLDPEAMLRRAVACAVSNALVWDAGAVNPDEVDRLADEIVVEPIG